MSSYNTITKIKYTGTPSDLVTLQEYIVFQDDKAKKKYIIFNFINNVTQQLLGMQFEVCQYNVEGNLIEKSVVVYNKFLAGAEEAFVPKAKLRVSYHCNSISIRLIQAAYDRFVWKEGEYEDNSYKFEHFFHDEKLLDESGDNDGKNGKRASSKANGKQKKEPKEPKQKKHKKSKRPFVMKDATKKNFSRFPKFFNVVAMLAVIAFVLTSLLIFKKDGKTFTYGDYNLRVVYEDKTLKTTGVSVYGYNGDKTELVIPEKLGDYTVVMVDGGAFENSKLTTVEFKGDVSVEKNAFKNCKSLTRVSSTAQVSVQELAFTECPALASVYLPNSVLVKSSFAGCARIPRYDMIYFNVDRVSYDEIIAMPTAEK